MSDNKPATFLDHKVTHDGLFIRGMTSGQTIYGGHILEIFVDRADAELFGWIDPCDCELCQQEEEKKREEEKKKRWVFTFVDDVEQHGGGCRCGDCNAHGKSYGCAVWDLTTYPSDTLSSHVFEDVFIWVQGQDPLERIYGPSTSAAESRTRLKYEQEGYSVI